MPILPLTEDELDILGTVYAAFLEDATEIVRSGVDYDKDMAAKIAILGAKLMVLGQGGTLDSNTKIEYKAGE